MSVWYQDKEKNQIVSASSTAMLTAFFGTILVLMFALIMQKTGVIEHIHWSICVASVAIFIFMGILIDLNHMKLIKK